MISKSMLKFASVFYPMIANDSPIQEAINRAKEQTIDKSSASKYMNLDINYLVSKEKKG